MALLLQSALLAVASLSAAATAENASACVNAFQDMKRHQPQQAVKLSLASGHNLPVDAGKYVMCADMAYARYFLVKWHTSFSAGPDAKKEPVEIGFCLPKECDHAGAEEFVTAGFAQAIIPELQFLPGGVSKISATSPQLDLKHEGGVGITALIVVCLFVLLVCASTAAVLAAQARLPQSSRHELPTTGQQLLQDASQQPAKLPRIIEAFSLVGRSGTLNKLVELPAYKPTDCLNGVRVLSMFHIILGHTFLMPNGVSGYANEQDMFPNPLNRNVAERNPLFAIITSAQAGVDTFFFLSGFLLSYLTLKELASGKVKVLGAILLRYLRLTPSLALTMLVYYKIWVYFGYGPFAVRFQDGINRRCDGSWWSELTYTLNFVPFDSDKVCMGWSWYLGDDMIFFIISLLILPVYHARKWLGWCIILLLTGMSFAVTTWLVVGHNLSIYPFDDHWTDYAFWAYSKPYTRVPAYFVGIVAAWVLREMEQRGFTRESRPDSAYTRVCATIAAVIAWTIILFLTLIVSTDFGDHQNSWGTLVSVLYINLSRPVWAMGWAVITLLCYYDFMPLVNGFLSHRFWAPMARLTYGAYLVHPLVIKLAAGRSLQYYTFNSLDIIYRTSGNIMMSYTGALALWVLVERPFMTILSPSKKTPSKSQADSSQKMSVAKMRSVDGSSSDVNVLAERQGA